MERPQLVPEFLRYYHHQEDMSSDEPYPYPTALDFINGQLRFEAGNNRKCLLIQILKECIHAQKGHYEDIRHDESLLKFLYLATRAIWEEKFS